MRTLHTFAFFLGCLLSLHAACDKLRSVTIADTSQSSATVSWKDNNTNIIGYQVAYNFKSNLLKDATKIPIVATKSAMLSGLQSGTAYIFWIRTICAISDTSKWEGPFPLVTVLSNPSTCSLVLELSDNSCNSPRGGDEYSIEVSNIAVDANVYLASVSLIISHTWPADLIIRLENPQGQSIVLSKENGTITDNFGIVDEECDRPCIFSSEACQSIKVGSPPFEGNFEPEESLRALYTSNPNGRWKLKICDGAINDKGILHFVSLKFSTVQCKPIENYFASTITDKSFEVKWTQPENCDLIEVHYKKKTDAVFEKTTIGLCSLEKISITGLSPDTEYDYYLISDCGALKSSPTCIRTIKTLCASSLVTEDFDDLANCDISCNVQCNLVGSFKNINTDDLDWIVNEGNTPTEYTGPESGLYAGGKYIYLESNPSLCASNKTAVLESKCLKMKNVASSACDLSFFYNMYGKDIGQLTVKKTIDNGNNWTPIFLASDDKGKDWINAFVDLDMTDNQLFKIRFEANTKDGEEGDIALDQINIAAANTIVENVFYLDVDGDGYGIAGDSVLQCSSTPPIGYAKLKGDCNDSNASINPANVDVPCNLIDENCDGKLELTDNVNPMSIVSMTIVDETCKGKKDGKINVVISGGTMPYTYKWNDVLGLDSLINISNGFYKVKITDVNGCGIESSVMSVKTKSNFNVFIDAIKKPSCKGVDNGEISIKHNGFFPPFQYTWSNGSTMKNITAIKEGTYKVVVKDNLGCESELADIIVTSTSTLNAVNSFAKHPLCYGDTTGILDFDVIQGVQPYTYTWQDGYNKKRREHLSGGVYKVTISDALNCNTELVATVKQPDSISIRIVNIEEVRCFGNTTGQIKLKISGGVEPYDFLWSDQGFTLQNRNNLKAGLYSVTVSDNNGCKNKSTNIRIKQSDSLYYAIDQLIDASCLKKADGVIKTSIYGGSMPYKYYWSSGTGQDGTNENLIPLTYTLTIVDDNNCKLTTDAFEIKNKNLSYPVAITILSKLDCPNKDTGSIEANCPNAKPPLDFNWSKGIQNKRDNFIDTIKNLSSGSYNVTITDNESCVSVSQLVELQKIQDFNALIDTKNNICNSDTMGQINVKISGGSAPYLYQWSNELSKDTIKNLKNGTYSFEVEDAKGCIFRSQPINISSTSNISVTYTSTPTIKDKKEGALKIYPAGGKGKYNIAWDDPTLTNFTPEGLADGKYFFRVSDELNCSIDTFALVDLLNDTDEPLWHKIKAFPNPFVDKILISAATPIREIYIKSITGVNVNCHWKAIDENTFELNFCDLVSGIYIAEVKLLNHSSYLLLQKL